MGFLVACEPWLWGALMLACQEHQGECPSEKGRGLEHSRGRTKQEAQGCHSSLLVPVVSPLLSPFTIPRALWRANTLEFMDVGSGVWK